MEEEQPVLELASIWDASTAVSGFTHEATLPAPISHDLKKNPLIYLFERVIQREQRRGGGVFHLLVHSPIVCNGRSCANPKPGARSFFQVSHVSAGAQGIGPSSTAFPGPSRELDQKWSSRDSNQCPHGMLALQAVALPATSLDQPQQMCFIKEK